MNSDIINEAENQRLLEEILYDPDTVDFVIRRTEYFNELILNNPDIAVARILAGRYAIAYAREAAFKNIAASFGSGLISIGSIVLGLLDRASMQSSGILQVHEQPYLELRGRGVIVGIVDTGIDYTLDTFRYEDGTSKIQYIFDQTVEGPPPEGFYVGTEYTNEQINAALRSENPYDIVPEVDTSGHGTFLASIAAGREVGDFIGAAPDAELIVVKLRRARPYYLRLFSVPEDQEHAYESSAVMLGVEYILDRARRLNRPVAICLGLGSNFGSHDAFSIFEEYLSGVANLVGVSLCIAAGNESQARHHTQGFIPTTGGTYNIDVKAGENVGDIFISVWSSVSDRLSVSVSSPTGELVGRIPAKPGQQTIANLVLEDASVQVSYYFPVEGTGGQLTAIKLINATPGIWTITVYGDLILNGIFHSWLPLTGFVHPSVEYLAANPYYTVTVPSTMDGAITCGAYSTITNSLYALSSWGPSRTGDSVPDLVAPGVGVMGYYPYGRGTMDGTSVAAAITTGAAALMLQWGIVEKNDPAMSTYQIRAYLIRGCSRSEARTYPNEQWGYGVLNLLQSFQLMREI